MGHEHFWTSGTDQAEEGKYVATNKINKIKTNEFSFQNFLPLFLQPSPTYSLPDFSPFLAGSSGWPLASPSLLRPGIQESQITSSECNKGGKHSMVMNLLLGTRTARRNTVWNCGTGMGR